MFSKNHRIHLNSVLGSLGLGVLLLFGACSADFGDLFNPVRVERHEHAGVVNLAVTMVAPWEDLIVAMSPKIGMNYQTAKTEVLPITFYPDPPGTARHGREYRHFFSKTSSTHRRHWRNSADGAHGTAIMLRAEQEGISPEALIERVSQDHQEDFARYGLYRVGGCRSAR